MTGLFQRSEGAGSGPERTGARRGLPSPDELSGRRWVGERALDVLRAVRDRIRERCEPFTPLSIFLGGSAVHGELCGIEEPGGRRHFLSDLDVGLLTARPVPRGEREALRSEAAELSREGPRATIGFYTPERVRGQDPTLGLVETVRRGFVLDGALDPFPRFGMPEPGEIPPWEARRLLGNRVLEWAEGLLPPATDVERVYRGAKLQADVAAVLLLARRSYEGGGFADRARGAIALGLPPDAADRIAAWTAWRVDPTWERTPLGGSVDRVEGSDALRAEMRAAVGAAVRLVSGGESAEALFKGRGVRGRRWARSWKRWLARAPAARRRLAPGFLLRSPRTHLWIAAVDWAQGRDDRAARRIEVLAGRSPGPEGGIVSLLVDLGAAMSREGVD